MSILDEFDDNTPKGLFGALMLPPVVDKPEKIVCDYCVTPEDCRRFDICDLLGADL